MQKYFPFLSFISSKGYVGISSDYCVGKAEANINIRPFLTLAFHGELNIFSLYTNYTLSPWSLFRR